MPTLTAHQRPRNNPQKITISNTPNMSSITSLLTNPTSTEGAVLSASLASAIIYQTLVRSPPSWPRAIVKTLSTALLSLTSYLHSAPPLLVGALALGSLGDAFLAWDDDTCFLFGLGSFLVAHILYIVLFFQTEQGANNLSAKFYLLLTQSQARTWIAGGLAGTVPGLIRELWPKVGRDLRWPVLVYSLTIYLMANLALTVESGKVVVGAVMFTASDSILAAGKFLLPAAVAGEPEKKAEYRALQAVMQHAVWILYYGGQLLIALGFMSV
ncbi:YhhN-like protein-domain-containing protein [Cladorrhinum sp. PSN259]|nr:YhhN-like protein-domain-containing protein [Cladorrhinum sp. PSN259]